jgi:hypothetical protein
MWLVLCIGVYWFIMNNKLFLGATIVMGLGVACLQLSYASFLLTTMIDLNQQLYATAGNPKTPEREIMAQTVDPNPSLIQLAIGGICAFDDNVQALQEELGAKFTDAMIDELRVQTYDALNDTVAFVNSDNEPGEEPIVLGNPEDC